MPPQNYLSEEVRLAVAEYMLQASSAVVVRTPTSRDDNSDEHRRYSIGLAATSK